MWNNPKAAGKIFPFPKNQESGLSLLSWLCMCKWEVKLSEFPGYITNFKKEAFNPMVTASHLFCFLPLPTHLEWCSIAQNPAVCWDSTSGAGTHPHVAWSEHQELRVFSSSAAGSRAGGEGIETKARTMLQCPLLLLFLMCCCHFRYKLIFPGFIIQLLKKLLRAKY